MSLRTIAVFGGSRPLPDSAEYQEAFETGKLLAAEGFIVMNGGYAGTMEASSRGARENGGRSIGVISGEFDYLAPNPFLDETVTTPDLFTRIRQMQYCADGFIVLKGSMGTLAELALVWNLARIDPKQRKPIILVGDCWRQVFASWRAHLAVTEAEVSLLQFAADPQEAIERLKQAFNGNAPAPRAPSPLG